MRNVGSAVYLEFREQVVIITGGANGIGLETARLFAANKARVALIDSNQAALDQAALLLGDEYPEAQISTFCCAVNDEEGIRVVFEKIEKKWQRIDVLINNAGISMNVPTIELKADAWRLAMDVNVNGVFYCAQEAAQRMLKQQQGVIINMASMYGLVAAPERAAYCTSKAAVVMLTKALAIEWADKGIRVNAVAPGYIKTELVDDLVEKGRMDLDALVKRTPSKRLGSPKEIAALVLFLASEQASFMNGHVTVADGGWSVYGYI